MTLASVPPDVFICIDRDGFTTVDDVVPPGLVQVLRNAFSRPWTGTAVRRRDDRPFAIRNLLNVVSEVRELCGSERIRSLVEPIAGSQAFPVRGLYFDKIPNANWKVAWHQDLTIAVRERLESPGYANWTKKSGIWHVQPPSAVLESILTLRIHLDDTDEKNGALKVLRGTHTHGSLEPEKIKVLCDSSQSITCEVPAGGAVVMRPLLLHSSSIAVAPVHRRVIHLEFSSLELPAGLNWHGS
jgi:ectoine hydroxylase-related dioxygenase (phytanoyl-CoA dioxygenase family)